MITKKLEKYISERDNELNPFYGKIKEIIKRKELAEKLRNNWEKIDPSKVSDSQIRLECLKDINRYWVELGLWHPVVDTIQEIDFLLKRGKTKYGANPENYSEKKKTKLKNAYETFYPYRIKLSYRKLSAKEWAYFTYTPKKKVWKELFSGLLTKHLNSQ